MDDNDDNIEEDKVEKITATESSYRRLQQDLKQMKDATEEPFHKMMLEKMSETDEAFELGLSNKTGLAFAIMATKMQAIIESEAKEATPIEITPLGVTDNEIFKFQERMRENIKAMFGMSMSMSFGVNDSQDGFTRLAEREPDAFSEQVKEITKAEDQMLLEKIKYKKVYLKHSRWSQRDIERKRKTEKRRAKNKAAHKTRTRNRSK